MRLLLVLVLFSVPLLLEAETSFYKCDKNGQVVYSDKPCAENAVVKKTQDTYFGGKLHGKTRTAVDQLKSFNENKAKPVSKKKIKEEKKVEDPCNGVTRLELRNARISNDLMKCHTKKDVKNIYGSPYSISEWAESLIYDTVWTYRFSKIHSLDVYFKRGLVTKWKHR